MNIDFICIVTSGQDELYTAWLHALDKYLPQRTRERFSFLRCYLRENDFPPDTKFDAIVSPANSFGILDGGFDGAISTLLSPRSDYFAVTREVQAELYKRHRGFAPPGTATIASLSSELVSAQEKKTGCAHIVVCPTMPWPTVVDWHKDLVYNTVWAMLVELDRFNAGSLNFFVLMPSLATGTGNFSIPRFAAQFALAIKHFEQASEHGPWEDKHRFWADIAGVQREVVATWSL